MNPSKKGLAGLSSHPIFLLLRFLLAAVMLYAAIPKFFDWEADPKILSFVPFTHSIYNYKLLPVEWVNIVAMTLPPLELLGGLTLLTGVWLRAGSLLLAALQGVFLFGVAQAFYRGLDISCGCFVGVDSKVGWVPLIRDSFFLAGFVLIYLTARAPEKAKTPETDPARSNDRDSSGEGEPGSS